MVRIRRICLSGDHLARSPPPGADELDQAAERLRLIAGMELESLAIGGRVVPQISGGSPGGCSGYAYCWDAFAKRAKPRNLRPAKRSLSRQPSLSHFSE